MLNETLLENIETVKVREDKKNRYYGLCRAIIKQAIRDRDVNFFQTNLAETVCILAELDIDDMIKECWKRKPRKEKVLPTEKKGNLYLFEYKGKLLSLSDLIVLSPVTRAGFEERLKRGWTIEQAVETPKGDAPISGSCHF